MTKARRLLRFASWAVVAAVIGASVLAAAALAILQTRWGAERVRAYALPKVNQTIAGQLEVRSLRFRGTSVQLEGVSLRDGEGSVAAELDRLDVTLALTPLLRRQVVVTALALERPKVLLVHSPRGLNLARAIAARHPDIAAPVQPPPSQAGWRFTLGGLTVRQGVVDFRAAESDPAPAVRVEGLTIDASGAANPASSSLSVRLALDARTRHPLEAPLSLRVDAAATGPRGSGTVRLHWGDSALDATVESVDQQTQHLSLGRLMISPALLRAFVPNAPLLAAVTGTADVRRSGDRLGGTVELRAAETVVSIRADVDVARRMARALRVQARDVDLARLLRGGPPSHFELTIDAAGGGSDRTLAGRVRMEVPPGRLDGRPFGPVRIEASVDADRYVLQALDVALPGLTLTGTGEGTKDRLAFAAKIHARDLALLARSVRAPPDLRLRGRGEVSLVLGGRPSAPSLRARGRFPALGAATAALAGVRFEARAPDLLRLPTGIEAQLQVASARAGDRLARGLSLTVKSPARNTVSLAAAMAEPLRLAVSAAARVSPDRQTIDLDRLAIEYPQARWQLAHPSRLRLGGARLSIKGFELRAAPDQRLALDLARRGQSVDGHLVIGGLDLARLPAAVLPAGMRPRGRLETEVAVRGVLPAPEGTVALRLAAASLGPLREASLDLEARHRAGRITGMLAARALGADHRADFDLPASWPPPASALGRLHVSVGELELARLMALWRAASGDGARPAPKVAGLVALDLSVGGALSDPALSLSARGRRLMVGGERLDDVLLEVRDPIGGRLTADVTTHVLGRLSRLTLETPVVLGHWARRPPGADELLEAPFAVHAGLRDLPIAALAPRAAGGSDFGGVVSLAAELVGPVARLRGTVDLAAREARGPGFPATDVTLHARLGEGRQGMDARMALVRRGQPIADLVAAVGVGVDDLIQRRSLAPASLRLKGHLGPLALQRLVAGAGPGSGRRGPRTLQGQLDAVLDGAGTLGAPELSLHVRLAGARLAGAALGRAEVWLRYAAARAEAKLEAVTANQGRLSLDASSRLDLSLPALRRGVDIAEAPIEGTLAARGLDLTFLSAVSDEVRTVAGRLEADATLAGLAGAPQVVGKLELHEGRVVLAGMGELRDIGLSLHGDAREMVLDRLFVRGGDGSASVSGRARRQTDGRRLALELKAEAERFRLVTDGQPLGALTLKATARGTVAPDRNDIAASIDQMRFELGGVGRKDLQSLKRPQEVVLFAGGQPLDRAQARRYQALVERSRAAPPTEAMSAGRRSPTDAADGGRGTRVTVEAPRNLWVRGPDVNLEAGLDPGFIVSNTNQLRVFGVVRVRRGFVEVLGKRFDVTAGSSSRFIGPPERPILSVDATYRAPSAGTTVVVHVEGPADAISFTLRSPEHPEYGDTELLSLVATGHLPDQPGAATSPGGRAASLLGGLLASRMQKALTARLPIDVLTIEPSQSATGTRLEAGTYLGDDVYVAYVGRLGLADPLGRENHNEVHLEYQLTSRWSFAASYGDARQGSADLVWTKHY